jgi:hypothetical protein
MIRKHKRLIVTGGIVLIAGVALFFYWRARPDPKVAQARELGKQLADRSLPADQRRELGKRFREQMQQLSPEQRGELFKDRRKATEKRIADYFKKSRQEQIAQLDEDIDRMQRFRGQGPPGGPGNGPGRVRSDDERDARRRQRLDQTTPEFRAQAAEYFRELNARRQQRGLGSGRFGRWMS